MHAIRIYIVASHPLYAQGVSSLLEAQPDIQVVGLGQFSPATVREITTLRPDVVVIDSVEDCDKLTFGFLPLLPTNEFSEISEFVERGARGREAWQFGKL